MTEAALALSLERVLASVESQGPRAPSGRVVTLLKAGGGVGATAIGVQLASMIASHESAVGGGVCFADLDVQFGMGALFLDLGEAMTLTDILEGGGPLEETPLGSALALHRSGARLLAAPRDLLPLEGVNRTPDRKPGDRPAQGLRPHHPGSADGVDGLDQSRLAPVAIRSSW